MGNCISVTPDETEQSTQKPLKATTTNIQKIKRNDNNNKHHSDRIDTDDEEKWDNYVDKILTSKRELESPKGFKFMTMESSRTSQYIDTCSNVSEMTPDQCQQFLQILRNVNNVSPITPEQCLSQNDFLIKIITMFKKQIDNQALQNLVKQSNSIISSTNICRNNIETEQFQLMSKIPIDIMSFIGNNLIEEDINKLGECNRKLFQITQSKSFYINRQDSTLYIDEERLKYISEHKCDLFTYSNYKHLEISLQDELDYDGYEAQEHHNAHYFLSSILSKYVSYFMNILNNCESSNYHSDWLISLLKSINSLTLSGGAFAILSVIPINLLFDKNNCNLKHLLIFDFDEIIPFLTLEGRGENDSWDIDFSTFSDNYEKYFDEQCNNDLSQINNLESVTIFNDDDASLDISYYIDLKHNFKKLMIYGDENLIKTENFITLFHPNLKEAIYLKYTKDTNDTNYLKFLE